MNSPLGFSTRDNGYAEIHGPLTFETVPDILNASHGWLHGGTGSMTIDLKQVTKADSAGLALMVEWLRLARSAHRKMIFLNIPQQTRNIIEVSGLTTVFPTA